MAVPTLKSPVKLKTRKIEIVYFRVVELVNINLRAVQHRCRVTGENTGGSPNSEESSENEDQKD